MGRQHVSSTALPRAACEFAWSTHGSVDSCVNRERAIENSDGMHFLWFVSVVAVIGGTTVNAELIVLDAGDVQVVQPGTVIVRIDSTNCSGEKTIARLLEHTESAEWANRDARTATACHAANGAPGRRRAGD